MLGHSPIDALPISGSSTEETVITGFVGTVFGSTNTAVVTLSDDDSFGSTVGSTIEITSTDEFGTTHSTVVVLTDEDSFGTTHSTTMDIIPGSQFGSTTTTVVQLTDDESWGTTHSTFIEPLPLGVSGPNFDHEVVTTALVSHGTVADFFAVGVLQAVGPVFDHVVDAILTPDPLTVLDPDTATPPPEERNRIEPELVEFKSPGGYGLEKNVDTGRVTGFKF